MKKLSFLLAIAAAAAILTSCSLPARLSNTAAYVEGEATKPIAAVYADIEVSPNKIQYFYIPKETVANGGEENIINTAVREALIASDNADLMICLEKQIKYDSAGKIESVTITGYPARYKNFRSPSNEHLLEIMKHNSKSKKQDKPILFDGTKLK